jgi:hypothetical protein
MGAGVSSNWPRCARATEAASWPGGTRASLRASTLAVAASTTVKPTVPEPLAPRLLTEAAQRFGVPQPPLPADALARLVKHR